MDSVVCIAVVLDVCTCANGKPATAITDITLCSEESANSDIKYHAVCGVGRVC